MNAERHDLGFSIAAIVIVLGLWAAPDSWKKAPITRDQGIVGVFCIAFLVARIEYRLDLLRKQITNAQQ